MLQALIIGRVQEDHDLETLACESVVHDFVAIPLVSKIMQLIADILDCLALERCSISLVSIQTGHLTEDGLDQVTDGHTRGDSVWVDNHVWHNALDREGQVLLTISGTTGSLLTVTRGKLVTNLRDLDRAHLHSDEPAHLLVAREHHLVDIALL